MKKVISDDAFDFSDTEEDTVIAPIEIPYATHKSSNDARPQSITAIAGTVAAGTASAVEVHEKLEEKIKVDAAVLATAAAAIACATIVHKHEGNGYSTGTIVGGASSHKHKVDANNTDTIPHKRKPFTIILVDIKKAAEQRRIECVKKQLYYCDSNDDDEDNDDEDFSYVALSYRWGELGEQLIAAGDDYQAHITSFQLLHFYDLCKSIMQEPDMVDINYVWVDAICVDQRNRERRKATIYRMNDIYKCASWIIAVPDLHSFYLSISTTANNEMMNIVKKHRVYLYHLLRGGPSYRVLTELDEAWMDDIGLPKDDKLRHDLTGYTNLTVEEMMKLNLEDHGSVMNYMVSTLFTNPNLSFMQQQQQQNNDDTQLLLRHFIMEFRKDEWKRLINQRQEEIVQAVGFLQSLMEDWSNRTWVISEYHIAKKKTGVMKFWFTQLGCPELQGLPFFEFDFKALVDRAPSPREFVSDDHPFTRKVLYKTRRFHGSMRRRLIKRSFLEMMLETKASKDEDRFHSILPLTPKYKHYIMDRNTIASWGITDLLSVRMKLLEWVDTRDQLNILISCLPPLATRPLFPSFATSMQNVKHGLAKYLRSFPAHLCNFDLENRKVVDISKLENGFSRLVLCPKLYHVLSTRRTTRQYYKEVEISHKIWSDLGIDMEKDDLVAISIPLFLMENDANDPSLTKMLRADFQLVGNWEKNIWVSYRFCSNYKNGKIYPSQQHWTDYHHREFHVF
ncbi:hypothetical protein BC941DRAFT_501817 [Chlamydoabsidia padenii]|nr:hypothetical protein BC941DRAFT_501817 [Chlamydoabsidia padenii]